MPPLPIFVAVEGAERFRRVSKRLREAGAGRLQKDMRKALRKAGGPAVRDIKASIESMPVQNVAGGGRAERVAHAASRVKTNRGRQLAANRGGLRKTISSAVGITITAVGIRISVNGQRLPPNQRTLPMALGARNGWRHPVYGHQDRWVRQKGHPWFHPPAQRHVPDFRREINKVLEHYEKQLAG